MYFIKVTMVNQNMNPVLVNAEDIRSLYPMHGGGTLITFRSVGVAMEGTDTINEPDLLVRESLSDLYRQLYTGFSKTGVFSPHAANTTDEFTQRYGSEQAEEGEED